MWITIIGRFNTFDDINLCCKFFNINLTENRSKQLISKYNSVTRFVQKIYIFWSCDVTR